MLKFGFGIISLISLTLLSACQPEEETTEASQPVIEEKTYLYVASGLCHSGVGVTTFLATTASNLIFKVNAETGQREQILADYSATPAASGDSPQALVDWDENNLLILVRNGTTGRLETMAKSGGTRNTFGTTPAINTILATAPQKLKRTPDGGFYLIRTGFIEKINSSGIRQNSPYINSNLGACGTNALLTDVVSSNTGRIIIGNSVAANSRITSMPAIGGTGSCSMNQISPVATGYPTAMVFDSKNGKLLVAYAGNSSVTANVNSIHAYDFDESTGAISNDQVIFDAASYPATYPYLLFGISTMTLDEKDGYLYVATAISNATAVVNYAIEKFQYTASKIGTDNSHVLTRIGSVPFYNYGVDTKCISSIVVSKETTQ